MATSPTPSERLRQSGYHDSFLEHNQRTRDLLGARTVLSEEWRYLAPLLDGRVKPRVLDLACGSGTQAIAWAERGGRVVGIDFDTALLARGRALARSAEVERMPEGPPAWSAGDATRLPFQDGAFDVVFCNSLLEHVPDWQGVLRESSRVLVPGGILVVYTTNRHCPRQLEVNGFPFYSWLPAFVKARTMAWIMEHRRDLVNFTDFPAINWFTFPQMRRAFHSAGIEALDRFDLAAAGPGAGLKRRLMQLVARLPILKIVAYPFVVSMAMYGVRRSARR